MHASIGAGTASNARSNPPATTPAATGTPAPAPAAAPAPPPAPSAKVIGRANRVYVPADPGTPPAPAIPAVTAPAITSLKSIDAPADRTYPGDGAIKGDGKLDQAFEAEIVGPVSALILETTTADGQAVGGQQWDTVIGKQPFPATANAGFSTGDNTWQLAVYDKTGVTRLNADDGSLKPLASGAQTVRLYASDSGFFKSGVYFRLFAVLADGSVVPSPVFKY